jgi:antitoxin component YwqK of YwqJK toxin-antitoxin module
MLFRKEYMKVRLLLFLILIFTPPYANASWKSTIDGSNGIRFNRSVISLSKNISDHDRASFLKALQIINRNKGGWSLDKPSLSFLMHVNGKTITEIKRMASELEHKTNIKATIDKINQYYAQLRDLNKELKLTRDKQKKWNLIKEKLGALTIHQLDVYLGARPEFLGDEYRALRVNFDIINTGEETVKVFEADLVVNYGITERIYPIVIYNEKRVAYKPNNCFKRSASNSHEAERGSTLLSGEQKSFSCSLYNKDISGHTQVELKITAGEILNVGKINISGFFGSSMTNGLHQESGDLLSKQESVITEKGRKIIPSLLQQCKHMSNITKKECVVDIYSLVDDFEEPKIVKEDDFEEPKIVKEDDFEEPKVDVINGELVKYYDNGQLEEKGSYKKEGEWVKYWSNGRLRSKENFKNGREEGEYFHYHESGELQQKGNFKNGEQDGEWISYFKDGKIGSKGSYKNGKPEGEWNSYWQDGRLHSKRSYKNGEEEGEVVHYDENGQIWYRNIYKNGVKQ